MGGAQGTVYHVSITGNGLAIGGAAAEFPIPKVDIGDGNEVSLQQGRGTLAIEGSDYRLDVHAKLIVNLPENNQSIGVACSIGDGQLSGTVDAVSLSVAGTTLAMTNVTLDNDGLSVAAEAGVGSPGYSYFTMMQ